MHHAHTLRVIKKRTSDRLSVNKMVTLDNDIFFCTLENMSLTLYKGLVTPGNGYVTESKRTKMCRIWLSGDKMYLLYRSRLSRSVCGA